MNPFEMTVLIVAIVAVAKVLRAKYKTQNGTWQDGGAAPAADPDTARMREELRTLKERVAVLERIATDGESGRSLDRQIEALRQRD